MRDGERQSDMRNILSIRPVDVSQPPDWRPMLRLLGMWELESPHSHFGGYSALLALPDGRLVAYNDRGGILEFAAPGEATRPPRFAGVTHIPIPHLRNDIESVAHDPTGRTRWLGLERNNAIARLAPGRGPEYVMPPLMQDWPENRGPEAMARLDDGRFIVLGEGNLTLGRKAGPGLFFPYDPVDGAPAIPFEILPPAGYHPTDMGTLPDGRVLILMRGMDLAMPPFRTMLAVADPEHIREGAQWPWKAVAGLAPPLPRDNYEGLAIVPLSASTADIWIISDNNQSALQRTLLVKLRWDGSQEPMRKGAPEGPDAP